MQRIDFFRLDRPIQERFVAATVGAAQPVPLGVKLEPLPRPVLLWGAGAVAAVALLITLCTVGFGELESSIALHPSWLLVLYAALGVAGAFCARRAFALLKARRALPYSPGVYLFPSGVIDTRRPEFQVRSLRELTGTNPQDRALVLTFEDAARFSVPMPDRKRAEEVQRALTDYRNQLEELIPPSMRELALIDPLADNGFKNPFSPPESMRPPAPKRFQIGMLLALAGGALAGALVFVVRNYVAEDALYRAARAADTRAGYEAYLARGGKRPEVREILLPRTELASIVSSKSLDALEAFVAKHAGTQVAQESDIALQHALRAALAEARGKGSLTALKEFAEKHGQHPSIAPEVERAIEENWKGRLAAFEETTKPRPEIRDLFRRLLAYTAKNGSRVDIRFRRRLPESVERAETMIRKSLMFGGENSLPKQYFDEKHAAAREEPVGKELLAALSQTFPKDLVDFQLAPPMPDSDEEFPPVTVPTLLVTHRTEMSGGYLLKNPRAALTGIGVLFRVTFQIPKDETPHLFKLSTWNAPDLKKAIPFRGYGAIYEDMAERAFSKLPEKYLSYILPGLAGGA